jgi:hypothetical protein
MVESVLGTIIALFGAFGISFAIEKSPIKINPLTIIKKFLVGDIIEQMEKVDEKVGKIDKKVDENRKKDLRYKILMYKKSVDSGIPLSDREEQNAAEMHDEYKSLGGNSYEEEEYKKMIAENNQLKENLKKNENV